MTMTASFVIGKNQKQPKCPSISEWINKLWYTHTMDKKGRIIDTTKWVNFRIIIPSERSQTEKNTYVQNFRKWKLI